MAHLQAQQTELWAQHEPQLLPSVSDTGHHGLPQPTSACSWNSKQHPPDWQTSDIRQPWQVFLPTLVKWRDRRASMKTPFMISSLSIAPSFSFWKLDGSIQLGQLSRANFPVQQEK